MTCSVPYRFAKERRSVDPIEMRQPDGTWGEQETPRANCRRHAVQTATAALLATKAEALRAD